MYTFPEEMRKTLESSAASFIYYQDIGGTGVPILASDGFCRNTGMPRENILEWLAGGLFERIHPDDVGLVAKISDDFRTKKGPYNVTFRCRLSALTPKDYMLIHGTGSWQTMPDGTELAVIAYCNLTQTSDINQEMSESYVKMRKDRFYTDMLTGLPNINYVHEFGFEKVSRMIVSGRKPSAIYCDVESMQSYNNQYGFEEGDALLRLIASTLKEAFPGALVTRGAEDHFVLISDIEDKDELERRLCSVNDRIKREAKGNTGGIRVGICTIDPKRPGDYVGHAIDHARQAMKLANMNRRVRFFDEKIAEEYRIMRYVVENIDRAIENGWIRVYYHALCRIKTNKIAAFEALARWVDPEYGVISPAVFIPPLMKYHLLYKLDLCMFGQVCREIGERAKGGLPLLPVSVNFSRQDFDHTDVVERMNEIFEKSGASEYVGKDHCIVEVTEQDVAVDPENCCAQLCKIRESGYRVWLDDFGSGYSSVNMLTRFRFDLLKFDMDIIKHLNDGSANKTILRTMVRLAKELKIHTLSEGVETKEQLDFIREIGCELAQGYYYQKPESLESILSRIGKGDAIRACETPEEREAMRKKWLLD